MSNAENENCKIAYEQCRKLQLPITTNFQDFQFFFSESHLLKPMWNHVLTLIKQRYAIYQADYAKMQVMEQ